MGGGALFAGLVVGVLGALGAPTLPALAASTITINPGGCAGGGTSYCYNPESAGAATGSAVAWTNMSGAAHTASLCNSAACPGAPASTGGETFDVSINSADGSSGTFTFSSPGTYLYYCKVHGYAAMHATLVVAAASSPSATASAGTPRSTPSSVHGLGTPGTGAGLGWTVLLLPLGLMLAGLGIALRRRV